VSHAAESFDAFLQGLEPTPAEQAEVNRWVPVVRDALKKSLAGVKVAFVGGAQSRKTAPRPLDHVDLMVVLDATAHAARRPPAPASDATQAIAEAIVAAFPDARTAKARRGTSLTLPGASVGYDVTAAFELDGGKYWIPDVDGETWIKMDPAAHWNASGKANARAGNLLLPLLRALRRWDARAGSPLGGYHLEVMAYAAFPKPPASHAAGLRDLFRFLGGAVGGPCREPAGLGPNLDARFTDEARAKVRAVLDDAAEKATRGAWDELF
jgi:hypothetical protein